MATAIETFSVPGTDIFVIISGYFLNHSKVSVKRAMTVWLQILFYTELVKETFDHADVNLIRTRIRWAVLLLKYRAYGLLAIVPSG